jgi:N-acetylneuraminic acid mutarotase
MVVTTPLPPLPRPVALACGTLVGETLYIAGGQDAPDAVNAGNMLYRLDLAAAHPKWHEVGACPGDGRMLAVAAAFDGAFWLAGGVTLVRKGGAVERRYLKDAYRYDPTSAWTRVADLPHPVAAAPSPAPADASGFYVLGGDDGTQVGLPPARHRGFGKTVLRYDGKTGTWVAADDCPAARVAAPVVWWANGWVIPGGEVRPGIRSPDVWRWTPATKE